MFELITSVVGGVSSIAIAIITYKKPKHAAKLNAAISVAATAVIEIASVFLK